MDAGTKIVIVGGSGFVGTRLSQALLDAGYAVLVLDMAPPRLSHDKLSFVAVNAMTEGIDPRVFKDAYAIVNLAGAPIGRHWNAAYKKLVYDSRILTTRHVVDALASSDPKPTVLISASAVGYYGDRGEVILTESFPAGEDYLAQLCVDWEKEAMRTEALGIRLVLIRTANVLGKGGLLQTLKPLFKHGLGAYFGTGRQYMPWIHINDIVGIYIHAIENPLEGAYNVGVGITPTQKELFAAYGQSLHTRFLWRIPAFMARIMFGEFSGSLLGGERTDNLKIKKAGYVYEYSDLGMALSNLD